MELILILILVVAVIAFVAYPLFTSSKEKKELAADALDNLIAQRDSAYDAIRDLDFDFQMGKLSQADYEELRERYKRRAALALQQIDAAHSDAPHSDAPHQNAALDRDGVDSQIEEQVRQLRERRRVTATAEAPAGPRDANGDAPHSDALHSDALHSDAIEQEVARLRAAKGRCPNCGTPFHAGDRFCSKCGHEL